VLETALNWVLRAALLAFGAGALIALLRWMGQAIRERRERWAIRLAIGMLMFAAIYAFGHARMLMQAEELEEGRMAWRRFGDPRESERNRGEVRGWIMDCTNEPANALARYGVRDGEVQRVYPLGEGGANLIGAGGDDDRDYTVERVFARHLRKPLNFAEQGQLHPVGTDLQLTICSAPMRRAWSLLQQTGLNGAIIVQDVNTGALVAYAATGKADEPPFGIKRYAPPGSVFKLALAALWWDNNLPDMQMGCPSEIQVGRARIRNFESSSYPSLQVPREMLRYSCNTAAVQMANYARQRLGPEAFHDAYKRFGFLTYSEGPPSAAEKGFWNTENEAWAERMTPPPSRVRLLQRFNQHEWGQIAIGQGPVDVTPLSVSRFIQAIGNGGMMLPPTIEADRLNDLPEGTRVMKQTTSQKLMQSMLLVVDSGTAASAQPRLAGTGWDMGGKTGSADVAGRPRADGWFAGLMFDPERRPRYTVVVYLQSGAPGGRIPAAIGAEMTRFMASQARAQDRGEDQAAARKED
jgi:hypothetical protein